MKPLVVLLLISTALAASSPSVAQDSAESARQLYKQAMELYNAGRYNEAVPLCERAIAMSTSALGPEHSDVALSLNGLGLIYAGKGDYARAEPLYERALGIYSKLSNTAQSQENRNAATGNVAATLNNLAELYKNRGEYTRAESLYQSSITISLKLRGEQIS
jgi:tetratricopeptide (TPR) repeat protein